MSNLSRNLLSFPGSVFRLIARQAPLFFGAVLLCGGVAAGAAALANYLFDRRVAEASSSLQNLSYVVTDHANRSMQAIDLSVSKVVERLQAQKP